MKAYCKQCKAEYTEWLSDSKHCHECESEVVFMNEKIIKGAKQFAKDFAKVFEELSSE